MTRRGILWVGVLGLGAGCLPPPPACDDGCAAGTEDGTDAGSTSATLGSSDDAPTTAGPDDSDDDTATDDGPETDDGTETGETTGGPTDHCATISALYASEDQGYTVGNCAFDVGFSDDESYTLSSIVLHGGQNDNLLMSEPHPVGGLERLSGVIEYPWVASWNGLEGGGATVLQDGPVLFRIRVEWHDGPVDVAQISGRSIYTVIADGRIMRDQFVHLTNTAMTSGPVWLVDYAALQAGLFTTLEWGGDDDGSYDVASEVGGEPASSIYAGDEVDTYVCAYNERSGDVVAMAPYHPAENDWEGPRASRSDADAGNPATATDSLALQADWHRGEQLEQGYRFGNAMMLVEARTEDWCDGMAAQHAAYVAPTPITSPSGSLPITLVIGDNDDDGYSEGAGFYAFDDGDGIAPIVLEVGNGPDIPTALFYIEGIGIDDVASISKNGTELGEAEVLLQNAVEEVHWMLVPNPDPDLAAGLFFLLADPIGLGDELEITLN